MAIGALTCTCPSSWPLTPPAFAQSATAPVAGQAAEAKPDSRPNPPKAGPKYLDLRYDEDFSYLEGPPDSFVPDFFDPIKNVEFGDDWRLTLGGEMRFRMEAETNKAFGAVEPSQDTFTLYRYLMHADLRYGKLFRVFAQGIVAFDEDRDLPLRPTDENLGDVHQLFFDLRVLGENQPWTLRVGRQELSYGNERLVSPLEWANVRRRFDAVKLLAKTQEWDIDFWYAKPVVVQREQRDRYDEDIDFYGAYATYKGIKRHGIDFYLLALDDTGNRKNPNGNSGDRNNYTVGSRFWGKTSGFDYETELAGQWGHWAHDKICAWTWAVDGGYTLERIHWKPRIGAGLDWASGDANPKDNRVGTFDQLFPLGHKYFGFIDLIGRQNIIDVYTNLSAWPVEKKIRIAIAYHGFWLDEDRDALYDVAGAPTRRDPKGHSGTQVGDELDITLTWKLDVHSSLLFGYSHFWSRDFIIDTGPGEDADLFYVQYAFKF